MPLARPPPTKPVPTSAEHSCTHGRTHRRTQAGRAGGAVYLSAALGAVNYSSVAFSGNRAGERGGAVAHEGVIAASLASSSLTGNTVRSGAVGDGVAEGAGRVPEGVQRRGLGGGGAAEGGKGRREAQAGGGGRRYGGAF